MDFGLNVNPLIKEFPLIMFHSISNKCKSFKQSLEFKQIIDDKRGEFQEFYVEQIFSWISAEEINLNQRDFNKVINKLFFLQINTVSGHIYKKKITFQIN